jgi:cytochrome b
MSFQSLPPKGQAAASEPPALWDPLVRISHWGIALVVLANYALNKAGGWVHVTLGWVGLTLLLLRLIWGVVGSKEARFSAFPPNPMAALRHVADLLKGKPKHYGSHNPAGAMMVYALWACLAFITFSGLVMTDFRTPMQQAQVESTVANGDWSTLVQKSDEGDGEDKEGAMGVVKELHEVAANLVLLLVLLHVAGVFVEGRAMRRNLVAPMLLGQPRKGPKA